MIETISDDEIKKELDSDDFLKIPHFKGRHYPIEYLSSREFELLSYFIYKHEISLGVYSSQFDTVRLMKGTSDKGRDLLLQLNGKNVGIIQCKRYQSLITKPNLAREVLKFILHAIQDKSLIHDKSKFKYYFVALSGFNDTAQKFLSDFNSSILKEAKLKDWVEEVIEENESIKLKYEDIEVELRDILKHISINPITGDDLDQKLKTYSSEIAPIFFQLEMVANEKMLRDVFGEYFDFKSDKDLEKLRKNLKDIPDEKRMNFGIFSLYGYDQNFYKKILYDRDLLYKAGEVRSEINKRFIDYLKETIEKDILLYVTGIKEVSPFTKQAIQPYLFNKYATEYRKMESGEFLMGLLKDKHKGGAFESLQTIEQIKEYLLNIGEMVLKDDFSSFVGDKELIEYKKKVSKFVHAGFNSVDEMSTRFDEDMKRLEPVLKMMETSIQKILPTNPTLIMESGGIGNSKEEFIELLKKAAKLE